MSVNGKVVIVTGGGRGIGRCICKTYAYEGANVIISDKNTDSGLNTEKDILDSGGTATFIQTDVSNGKDIEELIKITVEKFGNIDILINNAGISRWISPYDMDINEWDEIVNTNLRSVFLCSREAAKVMREGAGGSIVNIASTRAFMSEPNSEAYAATKGGIISLTHSMAASFSNDNIQVNSISPGWIETKEYEELRDMDHHQHFSKRVGKPHDIARACLYLTGDGNNFITGTNIIIDGGMTKKMIYEP